MANTVIQLKKSATPTSSPAALANGELAINYADGKLYYKNLTGQIVSFNSTITTPASFSTVNANGSLILADGANSTLTLIAGNNIFMTGDIINDRITIASDLTAANSWANTKLANATGTLAGSLTTTGSIQANSYVYVTAVDGTGNEGGEIQLSGAGTYTSWSIDAYQNNYRVFARTGSTVSNVNFFHAVGGSVRMGVNKTDPLYTVDVSGDVNISGTYRVNGVPISSGTTDLTPANNWANTVGTAGNNYASVLVSNTAASINANAAASYAAINSYSLVTETAGNNYASVLVANTAAAINANAVSSYASINSYALSLVTAANNWANTKVDTITSNSTSRIWANAVTTSGIETVYLDLATSGVTAGVYGNSSIIPIITVDSYGRVTSIANVTSGGGGASVNVGTTAPSTPTAGNLWWNTNEGVLYIYYTDADSSQWVQASPTTNPQPVQTGGYYQGNRGSIGTTDGLGDIFRVHANTITADITIPGGYNALAAGPLTIQTGKKLTIGDGARAVIV